LRAHGYIEGQNIAIEVRYAEGNPELLTGLAIELVRLPVDIIIASSTQAIQAAKNATNTIPIVFAVAADPIASRFIASFERPGGTITGIPDSDQELVGKRLELLKETFPTISRVAVIGNVALPQQTGAVHNLQTTAQRIGITLLFPEIRGPKDIQPGFMSALEGGADAFITLAQSLTSNQQTQIADLAAKSRLPLMYHSPEGVEAGALMALGDDSPDIFRRAAGYVDKILKGAKPADLPVERPTKFDLIININIKTAKAVGLTIPAAILKRADKVIQ
jgi:putative ABC transport system substrate-binding protein